MGRGRVRGRIGVGVGVRVRVRVGVGETRVRLGDMAMDRVRVKDGVRISIRQTLSVWLIHCHWALASSIEAGPSGLAPRTSWSVLPGKYKKPYQQWLQ